MNLFVLLALTLPVSFANQFQGFRNSLANADRVTLKVDEDRADAATVYLRLEHLLRFEPHRLSLPLRHLLSSAESPRSERSNSDVGRVALTDEDAALRLLTLIQLEERLAVRYGLNFAEIGRETELLVELATLTPTARKADAIWEILDRYPTTRGALFLRLYVDELRNLAKLNPGAIQSSLKNLANHFGRAISRSRKLLGRGKAARAWLDQPMPIEVPPGRHAEVVEEPPPKHVDGVTAATEVARRYLCSLTLERELPQEFAFALANLSKLNKSGR